MSYFNDLQFLDLDDVSKEEADEIHGILYSSRASTSVVLPWIEDNVADWNQQSSYEGETSECSEGGGDCYQTGTPVGVPVATTMHQVYPPPPQVLPTVQVSYLPASGFFTQQPQHPHQGYDERRRRSKASPKRSGSGGNVPAPPTASTAPPYIQYPYHTVAVPPQFHQFHHHQGGGIPAAHHATGQPIFLQSQIPGVYSATPHTILQYSPHQQMYSTGMHSGPPLQDRSPKDEGTSSRVVTPTTMSPSQPLPQPNNDVDVGMGGGRVHMVMSTPLMVQPGDTTQHHIPATLPQVIPIKPLTNQPHTNAIADSDHNKAVEGQQAESAGRVPMPKSLPPLNAIKTTSLPTSGMKASPGKSGVPVAPNSVKRKVDDPQVVQAIGSSTPPPPVVCNPPVVVPMAAPHTGLSLVTTAPPVALGMMQPQIATVPTPLASLPPQSASVPPLAPVPVVVPPLPVVPAPTVHQLVSLPPVVPASGPKSGSWAGLFKNNNAPPVMTSLPPTANPTLIHNSPTPAESIQVGNKMPNKTASKVPPPQNTVVLTPPPAHLVAGGHSSGSHHGAHSTSSSVQHDKTNNKMHPGQSVASSQDPVLVRIAEMLLSYEPENRAVVLTPRGLNNPSNYCYINATLQALLACAPFYNLIKTLAKIKPPSASIPISKSPTPVIDSMIQFVSEFSIAPHRLKKERSEKAQARKDGGGVDLDAGIPPGPSFEPHYVYKMVHTSSSFLQLEGRQEDAEEFLTVLLNGLNDEMIELIKLKGMGLSNGEVTTNGDNHVEVDNSDWKEIINKGVSRVTRRTEFGRTPLTDIFMGQIRSRVERSDPQLSTDNIQPFFSLHLDVESCHTVEEALDKMTKEEAIEGGVGGQESWQLQYLDHLPIVLILHLKCFYYSEGRATKIAKSLDFPIDLKLDSKLVQSNKSKTYAKMTFYKLFAVVYHEGKEASKGHYLADVYHVGSSCWIRYDDTVVKSVSEQQVLKPKQPRVPYLLLYRRMDKSPRS